MRIFLRIMVVFLLIMSGVALYLGIKLFQQREQLKARVNMLELSVADLSRQIETEKSKDPEQRMLPPVNVDVRDLKKYFAVDSLGKPIEMIDTKTQAKIYKTYGPGTMRDTLDNLIAKAKEQSDTMDKTREILRETRLKLEDNQAKLVKSKAEGAALAERIDQLLEQVASQKEEIAALDNTVASKDDQISTLNTQIEEQKIKITKQEEKIFEIKSTIAAQDKLISDLQREIETLKHGKPGGTVWDVTHGRKGTISKVNPDFGFVVIATIPNINLPPDVNLVIRRDKILVAKVHVLKVKAEQNIAIGEILWQWLKMPIQEGDNVDYIGE